MITLRNCLASKSGSNHLGKRILTLNPGTSVSSMALYTLLCSMIVLTRLTVFRLVVLMISLLPEISVIFVATSTLLSQCSNAPVMSNSLMRSMWSWVSFSSDSRQTETRKVGVGGTSSSKREMV